MAPAIHLALVASATQVVVPFTVAVVALLALAVWWAGHLKKDFGSQAPDVHVGLVTEPLPVSADRAARIRRLSAEPLLLKQTSTGLYVQIENRPAVPVAFFAENGVAQALTAAAVQASQHFGPLWVALATLGDDDTLSLRRLS